jgi:hypothetical protein
VGIGEPDEAPYAVPAKMGDRLKTATKLGQRPFRSSPAGPLAYART